MSFEQMQATRVQKIRWKFVSMFLWLSLSGAALVAIISASMLAGAILNAIRDWWHYKPPEHGAGWILVIFLLSTSVALVCKWSIATRATADYQRQWLTNDQRLTAEAIERANKPIPMWIRIGWLLMAASILFALALRFT